MGEGLLCFTGFLCYLLHKLLQDLVKGLTDESILSFFFPNTEIQQLIWLYQYFFKENQSPAQISTLSVKE